MMKYIALALPLLLALASGTAAATVCNINASFVDTLNYEPVMSGCAVLADSQDFQACDQCFASLLSNVFFPLYKAIGIPIVMPPSPQGLTGIVSSTNWQGCDTLLPIVTEKLGNVSLTNLASCPQNKWGPMTIAATRKVDPGFLAGPPPVAE